MFSYSQYIYNIYICTIQLNLVYFHAPPSFTDQLSEEVTFIYIELFTINIYDIDMKSIYLFSLTEPDLFLRAAKLYRPGVRVNPIPIYICIYIFASTLFCGLFLVQVAALPTVQPDNQVGRLYIYTYVYLYLHIYDTL